MRKAATGDYTVASLSVDSWGVDYVLFSAREPLRQLPYHYRDGRTDEPYRAALAKVGAERIYAETGIQFLSINTLYQLCAEEKSGGDLASMAEQFLPIADYLNYLFSGVGKAEESLASTTQLYDPRTRAWLQPLIDLFGLPRRIFPPIVPSGTRLAPQLPELQAETGLPGIEVLATCSHDTGAAVAGVPASGDDWAFLSSGTWSPLGVEIPAPVINDDARSLGFTNEAGFGGTTRFLKNIAGMWLLQERQRTWQLEGQHLRFEELVTLAEAAEPFRSVVDPNAPRFAKPDDMPRKIAAFCRETNQPAPETPGQSVCCILRSLALLCRQTLAELEQVIGRTIRRLHIVGGGSLNGLLNQFTADATGRVVLAGPVEATAAGNVMIQAITLGHVASLPHAREIVRNSFPVREFHPQQEREWQKAAADFARIICKQ